MRFKASWFILSILFLASCEETIPVNGLVDPIDSIPEVVDSTIYMAENPFMPFSEYSEWTYQTISTVYGCIGDPPEISIQIDTLNYRDSSMSTVGNYQVFRFQSLDFHISLDRISVIQSKDINYLEREIIIDEPTEFTLLYFNEKDTSWSNTLYEPENAYEFAMRQTFDENLYEIRVGGDGLYPLWDKYRFKIDSGIVYFESNKGFNQNYKARLISLK